MFSAGTYLEMSLRIDSRSAWLGDRPRGSGAGTLRANNGGKSRANDRRKNQKRKKNIKKKKTANRPRRVCFLFYRSHMLYSRVLRYGKAGPKRYRCYLTDRKCRHSRDNNTVSLTVAVPCHRALPVRLPVAVTPDESIRKTRARPRR